MEVTSGNREAIDAPRSLPTSAPPASRGLARSSVALAARFAGALSLLAVGAVHLQQYDKPVLRRPDDRDAVRAELRGRDGAGTGTARAGRAPARPPGWARRGGARARRVGLASTAFAFLLVAERTPVFGFQEPGYDPTAIMASRVSELVTVGLVTGFLLARFAGSGSRARW